MTNWVIYRRDDRVQDNRASLFTAIYFSRSFSRDFFERLCWPSKSFFVLLFFDVFWRLVAPQWKLRTILGLLLCQHSRRQDGVHSNDVTRFWWENWVNTISAIGISLLFAPALLPSKNWTWKQSTHTENVVPRAPCIFLFYFIWRGLFTRSESYYQLIEK